MNYFCTTFLSRYKVTDFLRDFQKVLGKSFWGHNFLSGLHDLP